jgi:hypothetical protein
MVARGYKSLASQLRRQGTQRHKHYPAVALAHLDIPPIKRWDTDNDKEP